MELEMARKRHNCLSAVQLSVINTAQYLSYMSNITPLILKELLQQIFWQQPCDSCDNQTAQTAATDPSNRPTARFEQLGITTHLKLDIQRQPFWFRNLKLGSKVLRSRISQKEPLVQSSPFIPAIAAAVQASVLRRLFSHLSSFSCRILASSEWLWSSLHPFGTCLAEELFLKWNHIDRNSLLSLTIRSKR